MPARAFPGPAARVPPGAVAILAGVVAADQAFKWLVLRQIPLGGSQTVAGGWVHLVNVRNPGIAFSALPGIPPLVPAAIALTLIFLLFYNGARWARDGPVHLALALLAGGAVGNLIDRVRVGAVIDYLDLRVWPVFNFADLAITAGAGVLILRLALRSHAGGHPRSQHASHSSAGQARGEQ